MRILGKLNATASQSEQEQRSIDELEDFLSGMGKHLVGSGMFIGLDTALINGPLLFAASTQR
jgi:hypothetical protein